MPPSEIRKDAREALAENWGKAVCIILANILISFALSFVSNISPILSIGVTVINIPLAFGLTSVFMKLKRGETVSAFDFIEDGFKNFSKAWGVTLRTILKLIIPLICLIVVIALLAASFTFTHINNEKLGITLSIVIVVLYLACLVYIISRSFLYVIANNIAIDNPEMSSKDCVEKSEEMMNGNRGSYFLLELSFIGWALLSVLTFGIGTLWLTPYMLVAEVCFYDRLKNK